ncbi:hypothetical protein ACFSR6_01465 [Pedobacter vanadiisoli]|uniref:Phosphoesterase n=1 Tax=Pedobacter vanadiisoli TaxID=1761975 RepID=A0ABW5MDA2_9SPHI
MSNIFFSSDHHFGHQNIISFSDRPFSSVEEMDEIMIQKWNKKISSSDSIYYLGDFGLCKPDRLREILKQLNGNIYLIKGNHDKSALSCKNRFEWIKDYYELKITDSDNDEKKQRLVLFHYAIKQWNYKRAGSFHLYGHSHGNIIDDPHELSFDVGVDCHNYYPISYTEVKEKMAKKTWKFDSSTVDL